MLPATGRHGEHLILYDGLCGLCNRVTTFVLPRDRRRAFDFAALQSERSRAALRRFGRNADRLDTFYVVMNYRTASPVLLDRADAALFLVKTLGGGWAALGALRVLPRRLLNAAYDFVARHRYRVFGRHDVCAVPDATYMDRFIDGPVS